jgi:hypothetical protein
MIDRRSLTDPHPSLSGTDYVLEGASVRDRFLTAFILEHHGPFKSVHAARLPDGPSPSGMDVLFPGAEEETLSIQVESTYEPLTVRVIDEWLASDDDDDDR